MTETIGSTKSKTQTTWPYPKTFAHLCHPITYAQTIHCLHGLVLRHHPDTQDIPKTRPCSVQLAAIHLFLLLCDASLGGQPAIVLMDTQPSGWVGCSQSFYHDEQGSCGHACRSTGIPLGVEWIMRISTSTRQHTVFQMGCTHVLPMAMG